MGRSQPGRAECNLGETELAITRKEEKRALDKDEFDLVEKSHHPQVKELSDKDLADLVRKVRERRDRAKTIANQRRREMRGKASPRGAEASSADAGSHLKSQVLAMAMRRLNAERSRRAEAG
jgi:hypothetical protein